MPGFLSPEEEVSDEELQQLMALGIIPDQQSNIKEQMAQANALRQNKPEMRGNGRVMVAANPLEFLGQGIQNYKAGKDLKELKKQQDALLQQQVAGRGAFYKALRRPGQQPIPGIQSELDGDM
jgi:hypothetical protein